MTELDTVRKQFEESGLPAAYMIGVNLKTSKQISLSYGSADFIATGVVGAFQCTATSVSSRCTRFKLLSSFKSCFLG